MPAQQEWAEQVHKTEECTDMKLTRLLRHCWLVMGLAVAAPVNWLRVNV